MLSTCHGLVDPGRTIRCSRSGEPDINHPTVSDIDVQISTHQVDPLVLDVDRDGVRPPGVENGILFDLVADGKTIQSSFAQGDDVFLALDRNKNGHIDDGRELFGTQQGAANGFEELRNFYENQDGQITAADSVFSQLRDLYNQAGELRTVSLTDLGVRSISTHYQDRSSTLATGDAIVQVGSILRDDGRRSQAHDLGLSAKA